MIQLPTSEVFFNENPHGYWRGNTQLSGITTLIHHVKRLGVYPGREKFEWAIRLAGAYGTAVHKAIEEWDNNGIEDVEYDTLRKNPDGSPIIGNVQIELYNYIRSQKGFRAVANEYIVDYGGYASAIDNVWFSLDEDGIYLVDTKTCNVEKFPGGKQGLLDYLSWQLSCYAFMFERQTGLKVVGLRGNWFKKDKHESWTVVRQKDEDVEELLNTEHELVNGEFRYFHYVGGEKVYYTTGEYDEEPPAEPYKDTNVDAPQDNTPMLVSHEDIEKVTLYLSEAKRIENEMNAFKKRLLQRMEELDIKSFKCDSFTITRKLPSTRTTFDSKAFAEDHPDIYDKYVKTSNVGSSISITLK